MQVLDADAAWKERLRLSDETAADFCLTSPQPHPCEVDGGASGIAADDAESAWTSGSASSHTADGNATQGADRGVPGASSGRCGSSGPCEVVGLQKVLDAMEAVGITEEETEGLLKGVSAVLHLGRVSAGSLWLQKRWKGVGDLKRRRASTCVHCWWLRLDWRGRSTGGFGVVRLCVISKTIFQRATSTPRSAS